jgi:hypothetical protein
MAMSRLSELCHENPTTYCMIASVAGNDLCSVVGDHAYRIAVFRLYLHRALACSNSPDLHQNHQKSQVNAMATPLVLVVVLSEWGDV